MKRHKEMKVEKGLQRKMIKMGGRKKGDKRGKNRSIWGEEKKE